MDPKMISADLSVSPQIASEDVAEVHNQGFRSIICNRPDGEGADQPSYREIEAAAKAAGVKARYIPIAGGMVTDADVADFGAALHDMPGPTLAYCRTGTRSATLWSLAQAGVMPLPEILGATKAAGYDMGGVARRIANGGKTPTDKADVSFDVVIVGGGAAGIAVAASLLSRKNGLEIAIIDPADVHYYQPGWTLVGAGVFRARADGPHHGVAAFPMVCTGSSPPSRPSSPRPTPSSSMAVGWSDTSGLLWRLV